MTFFDRRCIFGVIPLLVKIIIFWCYLPQAIVSGLYNWISTNPRMTHPSLIASGSPNLYYHSHSTQLHKTINLTSCSNITAALWIPHFQNLIRIFITTTLINLYHISYHVICYSYSRRPCSLFFITCIWIHHHLVITDACQKEMVIIFQKVLGEIMAKYYTSETSHFHTNLNNAVTFTLNVFQD